MELSRVDASKKYVDGRGHHEVRGQGTVALTNWSRTMGQGSRPSQSLARSPGSMRHSTGIRGSSPPPPAFAPPDSAPPTAPPAPAPLTTVSPPQDAEEITIATRRAVVEGP